MKQLLATFLVASMMFAGAAPFAVAAPPQMGGEKSLYTRLGGYDAIAAVNPGFHNPSCDRSFSGQVLRRTERHFQGKGRRPRD